jgi:zinc D-Ala-D-Ala carboxypeptidase
LPWAGSLLGMDARRSSGRLLILLFAVALVTAATATVSAAPALPPCKIADTLTKFRALGDWNRAILDPTYRLSSAHKPTDLRSTTNAGLNGGQKVRRFVIADLKAMASAARKAGARFSVQSSYRSYTTQKATFAHWVAAHGYAYALTESARAGHSEHQLGTTVDLRKYGGAAPWDVKNWGDTKVGTWLRKNAWKYGFVMSYPKGKSAVTCYMYEPWHFRYVGRATAKQVHDSGLTLREFLWLRQNAAEPTPTPTPEPTPTPTPEPTPTPTPAG